MSNLTKERIHDYLRAGKRFDGRGLFDYRDIVIETGISKNAEGSARVKIGDTEVVAGVKLGVSEPYPDSPDEGALISGVEHLPLSSPHFESGPPSIHAIEMARIVDRGIRESGFIDFKKLCIKEGEKAWTVFLDIYSINDAGNLMDASALAAVAALKTAHFPEYDKDADKVIFGSLTDKKLPLTESMPITLTYYKVNNAFILDPISLEEESSDMRISIAMSRQGKKVIINACQKSGEVTVAKDELISILEKAMDKWKQIEPKVAKLIDKK
ncbi:exosome complex protein Rrp42 [Candidatus Pacearchaeota archaeon]|nr:exosome complex protein Rrp42 [Candidatus Pacearchaeota archaeon]